MPPTADYVRHLEAERDLLIARQDALVRYLGRAEFLRAVGEAEPCEVSPIDSFEAP